MVNKCSKCNKNITKTKPGLTCSRCNKIVHADTSCVKLSNKQLHTLRNSSGIEWSCDDCLKNLSRRSSYLIPDEDEENMSEDGSVVNVTTLDTKKLIKDISRELKKTFREELVNLENTLEFLGDKMTELEQSIKNQESIIKKLENKNEDLANRNKHLELRVAVMEQGMRVFEQKSLSNSLEIAGLPDVAPKDVAEVVKKVALKLDLNENDVQNIQKTSGTKDKPGPILLEMKTSSAYKQWVEASKNKCLTVGAVLQDAARDKVGNRIYVREALTKHNKTLLYNAKMKLNKSYQYIWCKDGKVFVRKDSDSKINYIRSQQDIDSLSKSS